MENLKEQYDEIVTKRKKIIDQINFLVNDEKVKKYFKLRNENSELAYKEQELYKKLKIADYSSCNHIWVRTLICDNGGDTYCGCIKCGLDQTVLRLRYIFDTVDIMSFEQRLMYNFMTDTDVFYDKGIESTSVCDLELAKAIYSRIKEVHPDIDDETARKYFEIALNDIRRIKVNNERKASRIRRLKLNSGFNNWN